MQQTVPHDQLFTFPEAMHYLRVSRSTLYRLMNTGQLVGHKVGSTWRFYQRDIQACVEADSTPEIITLSEQQFLTVIEKARKGEGYDHQ